MSKLFPVLIMMTATAAALANSDAEAFIKESQKVSKAAAHATQKALKALDLNPKGMAPVKADIERYFSGSLKAGQSCGDNRCTKTLFAKSHPSEKSCKGQPVPADPAATPLLIFVSASMPKESLRALHQEASRIGARLVFRGLIGDSFKQTQVFFREAQIVVDIDPTAFTDHNVAQVPTFILSEANSHDRLQGHISLTEALTQFKDKGQLKATAKRLLQQLQERR